MPSIKLVAFDFDGVVAETIREWYTLSLRAYNEMGEVLESTPRVEEQFRQARSFLKQAEDCYFVFKAIQEERVNFASINQEEFNQRAAPFLRHEGKLIAQKIFALREEMRIKNREEWLRLFSIVPGIVPILKKVKEQYEVVIATTRDSASVMDILAGEEIVLDTLHIIGREFSTDKRKQMKHAAKVFEVALNEIFFVDDILEQLTQVAPLTVEVALASWGYSNKLQRTTAEEQGIPVLDEPDEILLWLEERF